MIKLLSWKRVILKINRSFYVGLPIDYVENMGLERNVIVRLEQNEDGSLTLRPLEESSDASN